MSLIKQAARLSWELGSFSLDLLHTFSHIKSTGHDKINEGLSGFSEEINCPGEGRNA